MKDSQRRLLARTSKKRRITVTPRFFAFILVLMAAYVGFGFIQRQLVLNSIQAKIRATKNELAAMEARNEELEKSMEYLLSDEFVEKMAREKLNLVYPGEELYVVSDTYDPDNPFHVEKRPDAVGTQAGY